MAKFIVGCGLGEAPFVSIEDIVAVDHTQVDLYNACSLDEVVYVYLRSGHKIPIYAGASNYAASMAFDAVKQILDSDPYDLHDLVEMEFIIQKEKGLIPKDEEFSF